MKRRILYICHNHLTSTPGGVEVYALELYEAVRATPDFEPLLLSRTGAPHDDGVPVHHGAMISSTNGDPHQYLFFTDLGDYNALMLTNGTKQLCTTFFREFLLTYKPDLIHFHHTLFLGLEFIVEARYTLPDTPIVYTLHEYLPICHNHGQMVRTHTDAPCLEASPRRCHQCFPDISAQSFFLRSRFVAAHFEHIDQFIAPSLFLLERFVDWGIPREKILFEEYGRTLPEATPVVDEPAVPNRFAFFGRLSHFKGVTVLLEAVRILMAKRALDASNDFQLHVYGSGLEIAMVEYQQRVKHLLDDTKTAVTFHGEYSGNQLPQLMSRADWVIVPSIWWENSPLVIQESFANGKPVICSNIGGMAEKVHDGVSGLHFQANDPISLAETMRRAMSSRELWKGLRRGIPSVYDMSSHVGTLTRLYRRLMTAGRAS